MQFLSPALIKIEAGRVTEDTNKKRVLRGKDRATRNTLRANEKKLKANRRTNLYRAALERSGLGSIRSVKMVWSHQVALDLTTGRKIFSSGSNGWMKVPWRDLWF